MQIVKKINNNVALGVDDRGNSVVVFGKGIGFPHTPYVLKDERQIERLFYGVNRKIAMAIESITPENLLAAADVADLAGVELDRKLNPNLPFILADHIQFAQERLEESLDVKNPLEDVVMRVYPVEYHLGVQGVGMIAGRTGVKLPEYEATNIALHIVNAEGAPGLDKGTLASMHDVMESTSVIEKFTSIIEGCFDGVKLDTSSYEFMRFAAHIRYLVSRLSSGDLAETSNRSLFSQAAEDFPEAYTCVRTIDMWLRSEKGWKCTEEELLYLMIHINRLVTTSAVG